MENSLIVVSAKEIAEMKNEVVAITEVCPKCNNKLSMNIYHRAVDKGYKFFCYKCFAHVRLTDNKVVGEIEDGD